MDKSLGTEKIYLLSWLQMTVSVFSNGCSLIVVMAMNGAVVFTVVVIMCIVLSVYRQWL